MTTSSTEAELLALSEMARQSFWWKVFFDSIQFHTKQQTVIHCDNKHTLSLVEAETPRLMTRLKHIDIHSCWLRQEVQRKRITTGWTPNISCVSDPSFRTKVMDKRQR